MDPELDSPVDRVDGVNGVDERLDEREQAWARRSASLWREAHAIAKANPGVDAGDVYHALRLLDLSPTERLRRGLTRVRPRPHAR